MKAVNEMKSNEIKDNKVLIGVEISDVKKMLGYWWVCESTYVNTNNGHGVHTFKRAGYGNLVIYTQYKQNNNGKNSNLVVDVR